MFTYMPTLPDYPWISWIWHLSPALAYGSSNLPDKKNIIFGPFLCLSLRFSPFFPQHLIFSTCCNDYFGIKMMVANFDSMHLMLDFLWCPKPFPLVTGSIWREGGGVMLKFWGCGVVKKERVSRFYISTGWHRLCIYYSLYPEQQKKVLKRTF